MDILFVVAGTCCVYYFFRRRSIKVRVMNPERRWLVLLLGLLLFGVAFRESGWMKSSTETVWTFLDTFASK